MRNSPSRRARLTADNLNFDGVIHKTATSASQREGELVDGMEEVEAGIYQFT